MERGSNMRKIALGAAALLLLAGCSMPKLPGADQADGSNSESTSVSQSEPPDRSASAAAVPSAQSSVPASGGEGEQARETEEAVGQSTYDAAQAVEVRPVDSGIQVVFHQLPQTAADLETLLSTYPQSDARSAGAFFIASLVRYVDSADDGLAMIDLLRGPRPLNGMEKDFLKDRLREKTYLPGAYFEGAIPENDYTPDTPWTLTVYDDPVEAEEGYCYVQVATSGADSKRRITLREKDGLYYLWEYSSVLSGIRLPAAQDPWL